MHIQILEALADNYIFASLDEGSNEAFCVDPGDAKPVLAWLGAHGARLTQILCTHHHGDHTAGIRDLVQHFPDVEVIGASDAGRIPLQNRVVRPGETIIVNHRQCVVLDVHAHTRAHVAYHFPASHDLFSGDTLFAGTCGAIFEGQLSDMLSALKRIRGLAAETKIWCAHEYSLMYLKNAARVEPWNEATKARVTVMDELRRQKRPTVPLLLADEMLTNIYLHWDHPQWLKGHGRKTEGEMFALIAETDG